jgi:hypothetical protein
VHWGSGRWEGAVSSAMEPEPEMGAVTEALRVEDIFRKLADHVAERKVKLVDVFYRADADGSRSVDRYEWADTLEHMGLELSTQEAELIFGSLDADGGGSIDIDEFLSRMKKEQEKRKTQMEAEEEHVAKIQARIRGRQSRNRLASAAKTVILTRRAAGVSQLNRPSICPRCGEVSKFDLQTRMHARKCEEQASLARREAERARRRGEWTLQLYVEVLEGVGLRAATHAAKEAAAQPQGEDPIQNAELRVELESTGLVLDVPAWPARQVGFAVGEIVKAPLRGSRLELCEVVGNSKSTTSLTLCRVAAPQSASPDNTSPQLTEGTTRVGQEVEVRST